MVFYTPMTQLDVLAVLAGASDPEAQRWLGSHADDVVTDDRLRRALIDLGLGVEGARVPAQLPRHLLLESFQPSAGRVELLIAVRLDDGRYAGSLSLITNTGETGGWLAPHARGLGLGVELFEAAAMLAHDHTGIHTVRARHEPENTASARALSGAGFVPTEGPPRHTLADGREIEARWLHHIALKPTAHCHGSGPPRPRESAGMAMGGTL
ncbi:GNAT family N-acetyltransferase [Streptomyces sp. NPDC001288]|uniref:GNAT family N-acetyltransferase n=1 Tax=unclassified Streptomyces TaxID=2593676 RepID=UPI003329242E